MEYQKIKPEPQTKRETRGHLAASSSSCRLLLLLLVTLLLQAIEWKQISWEKTTRRLKGSQVEEEAAKLPRVSCFICGSSHLCFIFLVFHVMGLPDVASKWEKMTYCVGTYVSRLKEASEKSCQIPPLAPGPIVRGRDSNI
ncbi:hypothetical protein E2C01_056128 [Portunus trituberculatus]|uniref:Uncharacterized protein n=1 Tax=Portunus trituberculatus TaxID=210409 RepID=A0A5B7GYS8_PORTR|nr:hypothetical protein [Portunus trituberculatus]